MWKMHVYECQFCEVRLEKLINTNDSDVFTHCNRDMRRVPGGFGYRADRIEGQLGPVMVPEVNARHNQATQYD